MGCVTCECNSKQDACEKILTKFRWVVLLRGQMQTF